MNLGKRIADLRNNKEMTQKELAKAMGVSRGTVSMWEIGQRGLGPEEINKLAEIFNVSTDYLLGRTSSNTAIAAHYEGPPGRELDLDDILKEEFEKFLQWKKERESRKKK